MKRGLLFLVLLILLIAGVVGLLKGYLIYKKFSGFLSTKYEKSIKEREKGVITNIVLKNTEKGDVVWVLRAAKGRMEGAHIILEKVEISYKGRKTGDLTVKADEGRVDRKEGIGILEGNVVLRLKDGILKARRIVWKMKIDEICVPGDFVFSGRYNIWGKKLCLYPKKEVIKVYNLRKVVIP